MINGKKIVVVMPAYNAENTLEKTVQELSDLVDIKILVDDSSKDKTAELSRKLGVQTFIHDAFCGLGVTGLGRLHSRSPPPRPCLQGMFH